MGLLDKKVVLITGTGGGLGRVAAQTFAREGAKVVVAERVRTIGEDTVSSIEAAGGDSVLAEVDVSKESDVCGMVQTALEQWGRIDVLFNNAGILLLRSIEEMTEAEWDRVMAVNVKAAFLAIKHVVPHMRRNGGGTILNTGSIGSLTGQLGTPAYSASKGAIALLTKSLALDLGRDRIRVNCICPGITDTSMLREHLGEGLEGEARIRTRLSRVPLGAILSSEDIARAAVYLVSDDSIGITGILHVVDGGLLAAAEFDKPLEG